MALEVFRLQNVRAYVEPNNAFSVDHTGTLGDFAVVPVQGVATFTKPRELYDPRLVQQFVDGRSEKVPGRRGPWSINFSVPLSGTGTAPTSGVAAISDVIGSLLKATMGGENLSTGTTIASGAAVTGGVLTANTGWISGMMAGYTVAGSKIWRPVKTLSGSTITNAINVPVAPTNGADVSGASLYTFTEDPDTSLQFIVQHAESNSCWVLLGGQGSWSLTIPEVGIGSWNFNISGHYWLHGSECAGAASLDGYTLGAATMPSLGYCDVASGEFLQWTNGTVTYTASDPYTTEGSQVHAALGNETWEVNIRYVDATSPSGVEGILRKRRVGADVAVNFRAPYQSQFWQTALNAATDKGFFRRFGTAAGSAVALWAPTTQIEAASDPIEVNEMLYQDVRAVARLDAETTASGAPQRSILKVGRL